MSSYLGLMLGLFAVINSKQKKKNYHDFNSEQKKNNVTTFEGKKMIDRRTNMLIFFVPQTVTTLFTSCSLLVTMK